MNEYTDYDINLLENDEMANDYQHNGNHSHHHFCPPMANNRINAFISINEYPCILNDYLENIVFKQIDQAYISNNIAITNNESGRTVVDISIDDSKPILGNRIKYNRLIESIYKNVCGSRDNILPVLQKIMIVQVNYQIENQRTGEILKESNEKLEIRKRDYFLDINVRSISDNAIDNSLLTNFTDALTITVNEFLHGSETMICRIKSVSLFYPAIISSHHTNIDPSTPMPLNAPSAHVHFHHGSNGCHNYQHNELYHFDNHGNDIHLHQDMIESKVDNDIVMIPVGTRKIDKAFAVNTGHRITFNYNIWKSDTIMVKNCQRIVEILGGAPHRKVHKTIEDILDRLDDIKQINYDQDVKLQGVIGRLDNVMTEDQANLVTKDIIDSYK